jgi:hypothetical protein
MESKSYPVAGSAGPGIAYPARVPVVRDGPQPCTCSGQPGAGERGAFGTSRRSWGFHRKRPPDVRGQENKGIIIVLGGDGPIRALYEPGFRVSIAFDRPNSHFFPPHYRNSRYTPLFQETERFPREKTGVFYSLLEGGKTRGHPKGKGAGRIRLRGFWRASPAALQVARTDALSKTRATLFSTSQKSPLGHGQRHGRFTT